MSLRTSYRCDRCAVPIDRDRTTLQPTSGPLAASRDRLDLCGPCAGDLAEWLAGQDLRGLRESLQTIGRPIGSRTL